MADLKAFAEQLVNLSVKDVNELANILRDEYGITPATPVAIAGSSSSADSGQAGTPEVVKSAFTVVLKAAGPQKLQVVKLIKELTGLGLKEAKELVDASPKPVKENLPKEEAEEMKKRLEESGAEVELK